MVNHKTDGYSQNVLASMPTSNPRSGSLTIYIYSASFTDSLGIHRPCPGPVQDALVYGRPRVSSAAEFCDGCEQLLLLLLHTCCDCVLSSDESFSSLLLSWNASTFASACRVTVCSERRHARPPAPRLNSRVNVRTQPSMSSKAQSRSHPLLRSLSSRESQVRMIATPRSRTY